MSEANAQVNPPVEQATKRIPYATADYGRLRRDTFLNTKGNRTTDQDETSGKL